MDSSTTLPQIETAQSQKEATANMLLGAASPAMAYANNGVTTAGLTFGYLGARLDESTLIDGGTHACTASTTVYMTVEKATGEPDFSTSSTNWDNHTDYGQAYLITAGTTGLTWIDCRGVPSYGILAAGAASGAPGSGDVGGPSSAVNNHLAVFDGTTGKLIKDGGAAPSGTNTGDETAASIATILHAATGKTTPVDADEIPIADSAASYALKKLTWANLKAGIWSALGALIAAGTTKATPVDGDLLPLSDSAASSATKYLSWASLKATLKTYFDTLYTASGSAGTVTHTAGALTASALMVGNGTDDAKVLASLGTTTTVLHGNAAGLPTFGAVSLTADVTGVLPVANYATGTPTGSKFVRDDGVLAVPPGATVTTTKGDLIARSASADSRLGVGTNGMRLIADSTQTLGVKWSYEASGLGYYDPRDYGCAMDGSTDDTTAFGTLVTAINAGNGGVIRWGIGNLKTSGGHVFTKPVVIEGMSGWLYSGVTLSTVTCTSATAKLFDFQSGSEGSSVEGLYIQCSATATAGAGIYLTQSDSVRIRNNTITGFWIDIDTENGGEWHIAENNIRGFRKYGIRVRNVAVPDGGDSTIHRNTFATGVACDACIYVASAGGLRITDNKFNGIPPSTTYTNAIYLDVVSGAGTSILMISGNSIENGSGSFIKGRNASGATWKYIQIVNNQFGFYSSVDASAIDFVATGGAFDHFIIDDCVFGGVSAGALTSPAITLNGIDDVRIGYCANKAHATLLSLTSCTNVQNLNAYSLAQGKTLTVSNSLTFAGTDGTTMTLPPVSASLGYLGLPINSQSAAYTLVLGDAGYCIFHPASDTTARTWTIPANGSVAFPNGTTILIDNDVGAGALTIAITTDTLVLVGAAGSTGSRTLAAGGRASLLKVSSTRWRISGGAELT